MHLTKIGLASLAAALLAAALRAQSAPDAMDLQALKAMSLQDLANVQVTSVSRAPEPLLDAASAIQVVTAADIDQSGATDLPEALRLADNLEVAQENSHDWAISARGFDADLADKLLVLVDGRAVYSPLYGGVLWNVQDYPLEDVDRIEVISGPAGTEWGANAVNGVINITTKSAQDTQGLYVEEAGGGSLLEDQTEIRYGGTLAPNVYYRVYGEYSNYGSEVLSDGTSAEDTWDMTRGGFRIDSVLSPASALTFQGDLYMGHEFMAADGDEGLNGGNLLAHWSQTSDNSQMNLIAYYDRTHLSLPYPESPASPPYYTGFPASALVDDLDTYDVNFQDRIGGGASNRLVWGFEYRFTRESDTDLNIVQFSPEVLDQSLLSGFAEDQVPLGDAVRLTIGSKLEHNDYTGWEVEPSVRALWKILPTQSVWAAVSRAVRTPSRYDRDLIVPTGLVNAPAPYVFPAAFLEGSPSFTSETELAYELGYRAQLARNASVSVSTYYNLYDHLRSTADTETTALYPFPYPVVFENGLEGHTYGAEIAGDYRILDQWRIHAGYDYLREHIQQMPGYVDETGAHLETADPRNQVSVRSAFDVSPRWELDADWRWVDKLIIGDGPTNGPVTAVVPSYAEVDARVAWRVTARLELSLVGQNLLHRFHQEYGYPGPGTEYIQRTAYAKAVWRY